MLSQIDKESLEYDSLIRFCEEHEITEIDAHYYLKLSYEKLKNKVPEKEINDILSYMYSAFDEHFYNFYKDY